MSFAVGDLVMLKSGGPVMTVEAMAGDDMLSGTWFNAYELKKYNAWFSAASLRSVDPSEVRWPSDEGGMIEAGESA